MERLEIWGTHYPTPSTWNELTRAQLGQVLRVLYGPEQFWPRPLRLLSILSGAPLDLLTDLPEFQVKQLYPLTDFVYCEQHHLTRQLLPELRLPAKVDRKKRRWTGPGDSLQGVLFGEFMFADTYFCLYAKRRSAEALDHFLAALYRPARAGVGPGQPDWNGDYRQKFNEHNVAYYAHLLRWLPEVDKLSILTWYRGCRAQLVQEFSDVFNVAAAEAPVGSRQQSADWGRALRLLSGGAFGPLEQTAGQHLRTILAEMNDRAKQAQQLKPSR